MFTEADRSHLLDKLIRRARADKQIAAAAVVGSAARGAVDRWSDIDLALGLSDTADLVEVAHRWTDEIAASVVVADTLDVWAGPVLYRVFLLHDSLQVDVSFWPAGTLAPTGAEPLVAVFGDVAAPTPSPSPDGHAALRWGWLYALHVRTAIARGRLWQATLMLEGLRNQVVVLTCLRHGVDSHHGRGVDHLPAAVLERLAGTLPDRLSSPALAAAYGMALDMLADEAGHLDSDLATRLRDPFANLRTPTGTVS
ncbi:MAG: nucleotidyltransferase domain-containing protein [Propionibacteriaceae bacterium]